MSPFIWRTVSIMRRASLNHTFRLVWSDQTQAFVAVAETAKGRGKASRAGLALTVLAGGLLTATAQAADLPSGGSISAGSGSISQSGKTLTVQQDSHRLVADWQSFSIGQGHSVHFVQPSASSVALNRVLGSEVSVIQGALTANGQVFLLNPNGVLFSPSAQVNVGGLVASTLNLSTEDFLAGHYRFEGASSNAIVNQGNITATGGGSIALIAAKISNDGQLSANGGQVLLGAGRKVTLDLGGPVKLEVEQGAIDALIANGGAIKADGGLVYLTAKAAGDLASTVINHTGIIEAQTLATGEQGQIYLLGDFDNDRIEVAGRLDASAPNGGDGGFIETSAARVSIADSARISTAAPQGQTGQWLIDPQDFTIAASGGDITGAALSSQLASNNVTLQSISGANAGHGDLHVNDSVSWNANKLTLNAERNININADLNASGSASLALEYGQGAVADGNAAGYRLGNGAKVNLPTGDNFSTKLGSDGDTLTYRVITALGAEGSTTGSDLQGINGNLAGRYVLGADINASATTGWNGGAGFDPLGTGGLRFTGVFDGLGHRIDGLFIDRPSTQNVGLFGYAQHATLRNVHLRGGSVSAYGVVGFLLGTGLATQVANSSASGDVHSQNGVTGGLVGSLYSDRNLYLPTTSFSSLTDAYASGNVYASDSAGGLIGYAWDTPLTNVYATGNVTVSWGYSGGLAAEVGGDTRAFQIHNAYATGNVEGGSGSNVGGLIGWASWGEISAVYATGDVTGTAYRVGGLLGYSDYLNLSDAYATGQVSGSDRVGGLIGLSYNDTISQAWASGAVRGIMYVGGLLGRMAGGSLQDAYATGRVDATQWSAGGLAGGFDGSTVSRVWASGAVSAEGEAGGLAGASAGLILDSAYASGQVIATQETAGGLLGQNLSNTLSNVYATGAVSAPDSVGGLIGLFFGESSLSNAYASGAVSGTSNAGGLIGRFFSGDIVSSYWNLDSTGQSSSAGGGEGKSQAQMMQLATFAGWDIDAAGGTGSIWRLYEGDGAPLLRSFLTPLDITRVNNANKTFDGLAYTGGNGYSIAGADPALIFYGGAAQGAINPGQYALTVFSSQRGYDLIGPRGASLSISPRANITTPSAAPRPVTAALQTAQNLAGQPTGSSVPSAAQPAATLRATPTNNAGLELVEVDQADGDSGDFGALASKDPSGLLNVFVINGGIRMPGAL
jgi:filamentous hemagglutinin family protein